MEAGIVIILVIAALVFGILIGAVASAVVKRAKNSKEAKGNLNIDCSDPADGAYMYLELSVPIAEVADQKQVTFNVHIIN